MEREMPLPLNLQHSMKQSITKVKILTSNASYYQSDVSCVQSTHINPTITTNTVVSQCTELAI